MGHIQEILDIKLMFELICMFFIYLFYFYPHYKWSEKRKTNNKTGESTKRLLNYYTI